jgi:hypothetical protein
VKACDSQSKCSTCSAVAVKGAGPVAAIETPSARSTTVLPPRVTASRPFDATTVSVEPSWVFRWTVVGPIPRVVTTVPPAPFSPPTSSGRTSMRTSSQARSSSLHFTVASPRAAKSPVRPSVDADPSSERDAVISRPISGATIFPGPFTESFVP